MSTTTNSAKWNEADIVPARTPYSRLRNGSHTFRHRPSNETSIEGRWTCKWLSRLLETMKQDKRALPTFFFFFFLTVSHELFPSARVKPWREVHRVIASDRTGQIRDRVGEMCLIERRKKAERIVSCVDVSHHRMRVCLPRFRSQRWPKLIAMLVASPVPGIWKRNHILCLPLSPIGSLSSPPFNESHCTIRTLFNHGLTCFYYSFAWRSWKCDRGKLDNAFLYWRRVLVHEL